MKGYIYKYVFPNGRIYIGQTLNPKKRHYEHLYASKHSKLSSVCELAIAKYGEAELEIIETIEVGEHEKTKLAEQLNAAEKRWIEEYDCTTRSGKGYNVMNGGEKKTPEQFILEDAWYEIFDKKWKECLETFHVILFEYIRPKLFHTNEPLNKDERYVWHGYKFMDYTIGKETTFCGFFKRHKAFPFYYNIGDFDYDEDNNLCEPANKDEYLFGKVITVAINEHWIRDIRETIWRELMKKKDKLIRDYIKGVEANSKL